MIGLRADHRFDLFGLDQRAGLEVRRLWGRYDYASDVTFRGRLSVSGLTRLASCSARLQPKPDGFESAAWWDSRLRSGSRWTLLAGLRFDTQTYDGSSDAAQVAPRLNVLYDLSADDAPARELGPVLPGAGHQRAAGRGWHRRASIGRSMPIT